MRLFFYGHYVVFTQESQVLGLYWSKTDRYRFLKIEENYNFMFIYLKSVWLLLKSGFDRNTGNIVKVWTWVDLS